MRKIEALVAGEGVFRKQDLPPEHFLIKGIATDYLSAILSLEEYAKPDVVIVDLSLPGKQDGVRLAELVMSRYELPVVVVADRNNASHLDAVRMLQPLGCLLHPYHPSDVQVTLELLAHRVRHTDILSPLRQQAFVSLADSPMRDCLFLRKKNSFKRVLISDILMLAADNNYTEIYTREEKFVYSALLRQMESRLADHSFVRVHRSYIINIAAVEGFEGNHLFVGGMEVPVSKSYRDAVFAILRVL